MLFKEYTYFNHKFPEPQYLGAEHTHLAWIKRFVPDNINMALDAFAGSQSVAFLFKQMGLQTVTNDFLNFNNQIGLALIENGNEKLDILKKYRTPQKYWQNGFTKIRVKCVLIQKIVCFLCLLIQKILIIRGN